MLLGEGGGEQSDSPSQNSVRSFLSPKQVIIKISSPEYNGGQFGGLK